MCGPAVVVAPVRVNQQDVRSPVCVCVCATSRSHTSVPVLIKYNTLLVLLKNVKTQLGLRGYEVTSLRGLFTPLRLKTKLPNPVYIYVKDNYTENPGHGMCVPL